MFTKNQRALSVSAIAFGLGLAMTSAVLPSAANAKTQDNGVSCTTDAVMPVDPNHQRLETLALQNQGPAVINLRAATTTLHIKNPDGSTQNVPVRLFQMQPGPFSSVGTCTVQYADTDTYTGKPLTAKEQQAFQMMLKIDNRHILFHANGDAWAGAMQKAIFIYALHAGDSEWTDDQKNLGFLNKTADDIVFIAEKSQAPKQAIAVIITDGSGAQTYFTGDQGGTLRTLIMNGTAP